MEPGPGAASDRRLSPESESESTSPRQLALLRSACHTLAGADGSAGAGPQTDGRAGDMERPSGERAPPDAAPISEPADADAFFEYDVESGAAGSASGGGGADTGCALTSPAGGSRELSPTRAAAAAPAATAADGGSGGGGGGRAAGVPVPGGGRRARGVTHRPQQSPSEKVDAWLRACPEDSSTSAEEDEPDEATVAAPGRGSPSNEPQFALDEAEASPLEDSSASEDEMADAVAEEETLDIRQLLSRGCRLLDLEPDLEPDPEAEVGPEPPTEPALACAAEEPSERPDDTLEGAVGGDGNGADADDEAASTSGTSSDFLTPDQLKRSTSLKSGKTPPQTPGRKKFVRFADAMGLDLQRVHMFRDEIPTVPAVAFRGLRTDSPPPPPTPATFQMTFGASVLGLSGGTGPGRHLVAMFLQPGGSIGFLDRLRADRVSLENVVCRDDDFTVRGLVRVLNMDFHKAVRVLYTLDEWRTSAEVEATYVAGSCDGLSDRFQFVLFASPLAPGERLQFAVRFECLGQTFWDNNGGQNYSVQMTRTGADLPDCGPSDWSGGRF